MAEERQRLRRAFAAVHLAAASLQLLRNTLLISLLLGSRFWIHSSASSVAGTETLIGIVGSDYVLLGADSSMSQSIVVTASNVDKIAVLVEPKSVNEMNASIDPYRQQCIAAAAAGDAADADRLLGMLRSEATISEYEAGVGCDVCFVDSSDPPAKLLSDTTPNKSNTETSPWANPVRPGLSVEQVARLARSHIAYRLRSATPCRVCLLVAGMERAIQRKLPSSILMPSALMPFASESVQLQLQTATGHAMDTSPLRSGISGAANQIIPRLYWLDEYGSLQSLWYGAHGHGSHFCMSILDQGYRRDMTREQAVDLMRDCFRQLRTRYVINAPQPPCIKCIDLNGCRVIVD